MVVVGVGLFTFIYHPDPYAHTPVLFFRNKIGKTDIRCLLKKKWCTKHNSPQFLQSPEKDKQVDSGPVMFSTPLFLRRQRISVLLFSAS